MGGCVALAPTAVRANASEVASLGGAAEEAAEEAAGRLARSSGAVVAVTDPMETTVGALALAAIDAKALAACARLTPV